MGRYANRPSAEGCGLWTDDEHRRFLGVLDVYPNGPWKLVAEFVGTRNVRQTMTHAQKYKQKQVRHERGLRCRRRFQSQRTPRPVAPSTTNPSLVQPPVEQQHTHTVDKASVTVETSEVSFLHLLQGDDTTVVTMVPPVTAYPFALDELDYFALKTPVVSECLDYLVRSFT